MRKEYARCVHCSQRVNAAKSARQERAVNMCVSLFVYHICLSSIDQTPCIHPNTFNSSLDFSISASVISFFNSEQIGSYYSQYVDPFAQSWNIHKIVSELLMPITVKSKLLTRVQHLLVVVFLSLD